MVGFNMLRICPHAFEEKKASKYGIILSLANKVDPATSKKHPLGTYRTHRLLRAKLTICFKNSGAHERAQKLRSLKNFPED
jgi:hypothetical protein